MDHRRGEELQNLRQHLLHECEGCLVADAEVSRRAGLPAARQRGVDRQHLLGVGRKFDLRDDRDVQRVGQGHHVADLLLRVEAARGLRVAAAAVAVSSVAPRLPRRTLTPGRPLGQLRVAVDLDPPARTVRQVPVETVQFQRRHHPQLLLYELRIEKVARDIQVQAPVGKARRVGDLQGREAVAATVVELSQRLDAVEESGFAPCAQFDSPSGDCQPVALLRVGQQGVVRHPQTEGRAVVGWTGWGGRMGRSEVGVERKAAGQKGVAQPCGRRVGRLDAHSQGLFQGQVAPEVLDLHRARKEKLLHGNAGSARKAAQQQADKQQTVDSDHGGSGFGRVGSARNKDTNFRPTKNKGLSNKF